MHGYVQTAILYMTTNLFFLPPSQAQILFDHSPLDVVLSSFVDENGLVDYAGLQKDRTNLNVYMDSIGEVSPESHPKRFPSSTEQLAYWINAYNASVLTGITDAYPISSVKDILLFNGFFNRQKWTVGGRKLTLDTIENDIIRTQFNDPRIHFVLNCGAMSCPPLENRAFTGSSLEKRLEKALEKFISNEHFFTLSGNQLFLSKIIDWYRSDFSTKNRSTNSNNYEMDPLISYFIPYVEQPIKEQLRRPTLKVQFHDYDWSLNSQPTPSIPTSNY